MSYYKAAACMKLRPDAGVSIEGDVITWSNIGTDDIPTDSQINAKIAEIKLDEVRAERYKKLAETDWVVTMHKEKGTNIPTAWKTYRQALRDITESATSLDDVSWPEKPE